MKTVNVKVLYTLIIFFTSFLGLKAQHTHIITNGTVLDPQLELEEEAADQYSRIKYSNSNSTDFWALSGRTGVGDLDIFGAFYNNAPRFLYINEDQTFQISDNVLIKPVQGISPILTLDVEGEDDAYINFTSDAGSIGSIRAYTSQNGGLTPPRLRFAGPGDNNYMTMINGGTSFGPNPLVSCGGCGDGGRVTILHNSNQGDQQLKLIEQANVATDYARIGFYNSGSTNSWNIGGRPHEDHSDMVFSFNGDHTLYLNGDENRVAINGNSGTANLHIKQHSASTKGFAIENNSNTNTWAFDIGGADLSLYYNDVVKGTWDDFDGAYYEASDRRLKNAITKLSPGVLSNLMKLEVSSYYYNDDKVKSQKSIGLIAQDVQKVFPELVTEMDNESDILGVKYSKLAVLAVQAIQEQQEIINEQAASIKQKEEELVKVQTQMNALLERIIRLEEL